MIPILLAAGHRVVVPDMMGMGTAPKLTARVMAVDTGRARIFRGSR